MLQEIFDEGEYLPDQVFNVDETELYGRGCQTKVISESRKNLMPGYKTTKDRLTFVWWQCFWWYGAEASLSLSFSEPSSVQFSSVPQSCPTLCNPMDCSMPGLPVHHQLPEFAQTHVHWVGDAIQPPHPLSSPSLLTFNLSQHRGLF